MFLPSIFDNLNMLLPLKPIAFHRDYMPDIFFKLLNLKPLLSR
jgi:hypothetical protein